MSNGSNTTTPPSDGTVSLPAITVTPADTNAATPPGTPVNPPADDPAPNPFTGWNYKQFTREPYPRRAVVIVDGQEYFEWESVSVRMAWGEWPPYTFRFTCSEQTPWATQLAYLRIRPGDTCSIRLDGYEAIGAGIVMTRQVAYNATTHAVEIQGIVNSGILSKVPAKVPGGELKNIPFTSLVSQVAAASAGIGTAIMGSPFNGTIDRATRQPGETAYDLIERYARSVGSYLSANPAGQLVLMGELGLGGTDSLIEGLNILEGREVIQAVVPNEEAVQGQAAGNDNAWGAAQNMMNAVKSAASGGFMNGIGGTSINETVVNSLQHLMQRGRIEANVNDQLKISVTAVHLGFQRPTGGLWQPGQSVYVKSPMLIMDRSLQLKAVTYSQDSSGGTTATLELVNRMGQEEAAK